MKELNFSRDSWHFGIATMFMDSWKKEYYGVTDICSYTRMLVLKGIILAIICMGAFFLFYAVYNALVCLAIGVWFWAGELYWDFIPEIAKAGLTFIAMALVLCFIGLLAYLWYENEIGEKLKDNMPDVKLAPDFLTEAYRHFKEKTCVKIRFQKEETDGRTYESEEAT